MLKNLELLSIFLKLLETEIHYFPRTLWQIESSKEQQAFQIFEIEIIHNIIQMSLLSSSINLMHLSRPELQKEWEKCCLKVKYVTLLDNLWQLKEVFWCVMLILNKFHLFQVKDL